MTRRAMPGTVEPPTVGEPAEFLMSGSADAIADAVLRMQQTGWRILSEPDEIRAQVWRMLVVRPAVPAPRRAS